MNALYFTTQKYKFLIFTRMKVLLCLFSLYILVLSGIPCRADDGCCMDEQVANVANEANNMHSQPAKGHSEYPQPCSPFFSCGACHGFVVPEKFPVLAAHRPQQPVQPALYKRQPLPDFSSTVWQPPKIRPDQSDISAL